MKKVNKILLIDDDTISSWLSQAMLERSGLVADIECLHDGQSAIDYLLKCCAGHTPETAACPDLIFLDLDMPRINGFDVLDALQHAKNTAWLIANRIIVLTTSIQHKDMERAKAYHIYDFMIKPLTDTKIQAVLERYLHHKTSRGQQQTH